MILAQGLDILHLLHIEHHGIDIALAARILLRQALGHRRRGLPLLERGADIWKLYAIAARAAIGRAKTVPADTYQDVYAKIVSDMEQQIEEVAKEAEAE